MKQLYITKIFFVLLALFTLWSPQAKGQVLQSDENPMGIINEDLLRCFTSMKPGTFTASYKFITRNVNNTSHRTEGFSIPLVGDLNGDGKTEIVALGIQDVTGTAYDRQARYIYIYDGNTGKEILQNGRFELPDNQKYRIRNGYHSSPAMIGIVDADRNGRAEIILALGSEGNTTADTRRRLVSYEVSADLKTLSQKWISDFPYDKTQSGSPLTLTSWARKPTLQIVDMDSDGNAEVLVYNKIYSATTGKLLCTLEDLTGGSTSATNYTNGTNLPAAGVAYTGRDRQSQGGEGFLDRDLSFPFMYDLDNDGMYEFIAGGKVYYNINLSTGSYDVINDPLSIGDGFTGVADINGDGKAEIVVAANTGSLRIKLEVWDPGFLEADGQGGWKKVTNPKTSPKTLLASRTQIPYTRSTDWGGLSYLYIGDIDGKTQNGKKFPEISFLSGRLYGGTFPVPVHPNVSSSLGPNNNLNSSGYVPYTSGAEGSLISFTWDDNTTNVTDRLKVSFILEHDDRSINTGFTMFDFDSDGTQEICYRDEQNLRVITPVRPLIKLTDTDQSFVKYKSGNNELRSFTGFEYPVVADIDNSGSANITVMGSQLWDDMAGYVYAMESKPFTPTFAPAPAVWNQFMYSPLKINENLQTPRRALHPLSSEFAFVKEEDKNTGIKTYIYNNTITQVVKSAVFGTVNNAGDSVWILSPVIPTPDAKITNGKVDYVAKRLEFYVKNIGDATLNASTPINVYRDNLIPAGLMFSKTLGVDVSVGDSVLITQTLTDAQLGYNFTVRVTDPSTSSQDLFMQDENYVDCNWADNVAQMGDFLVKNDAATVLQYTSQIIDLFANDILPQACGAILKVSNIKTPGGIGVMEGDFGKFEIINNKLQYTAPATYGNGIVKVTYSVTCSGTTKSADLYIFILENCGWGWAGCYNSEYTFCALKRVPDMGIRWYDMNMNFVTATEPVVANLTSEVSYYAMPWFNNSTSPEYAAVDFPAVKVTATPLSATQNAVAKWGGYVDTDWFNPMNWVEVKSDGTERPISWVPTSCVDVILAKNAFNYPILKNGMTAQCNDLLFEDRAMLAGVNNLIYHRASMETVLTTSERNRFVMWSAPFRDTYSGDYHFTDAQGKPKWGNVYMNFFQSANPDYSGSLAQEKTFTATFGSVGTRLPLGKAFNVKVVGDQTSAFKFSNTATAYTDANGKTVSGLSRYDAGRFIHEEPGNGWNPVTGQLNLPVEGNNTYRLIQVVNPFMAYLKVSEFLSANSSTIENAYKIWSGNEKSNYITIVPYGDSADQRYIVDDSNAKFPNESAVLIAPLQSFFVMKKNPNTAVTSLTINASMTTTQGPNSGKYQLRSAETKAQSSEKLLYVTATQGKEQNATVISNTAKASVYYNGSEDSYKLFNDEAAVAVYTITKQNEPLAVNTMGTFNESVKLGVRVKSATAPVRLDFSGAATFGHNAYLVDKVKNKVVNLVVDPTYTFTVEKGNSDFIELNDRFTIQFTGSATGIEEVNDNQWTVVSTGRDQVEVRSFSGEIKNLQVFNVFGQIVYNNFTPSLTYQFSIPGMQVYFVKAVINGETKMTKVIVK